MNELFAYAPVDDRIHPDGKATTAHRAFMRAPFSSQNVMHPALSMVYQT